MVICRLSSKPLKERTVLRRTPSLSAAGAAIFYPVIRVSRLVSRCARPKINEEKQARMAVTLLYQRAVASESSRSLGADVCNGSKGEELNLSIIGPLISQLPTWERTSFCVAGPPTFAAGALKPSSRKNRLSRLDQSVGNARDEFEVKVSPH
jgi:hypothetical protein